MPIHRGHDNGGNYYQWGNEKKYYYKNDNDREIAYHKATKQAQAIYASGYKGKGGNADEGKFKFTFIQ